MQINEFVEYHRKRLMEGTLDGKEWSAERHALKVVEELGEIARCFTKPNDPANSLAEELADGISCLVILAIKCGYTDVDTLLRSKFNEVSLRKGSQVFIPESINGNQ